jgi:hypothetical protein
LTLQEHGHGEHGIPGNEDGHESHKVVPESNPPDLLKGPQQDQACDGGDSGGKASGVLPGQRQGNLGEKSGGREKGRETPRQAELFNLLRGGKQRY